MFSSLTLAERNNDPEPWQYFIGTRRFAPLNQDAGNPFSVLWKYNPRPEFQHGVLPENPVLVAFRRIDQNLAPRERVIIWLDDWNKPWFFATDCTLAERAFAHRVLTLLSKIGANQ